MSIKRLQIWLDKQLKEGFNSIKNGRVNIYIYIVWLEIEDLKEKPNHSSVKV